MTIKRWAAKSLETHMRIFRIVAIYGPRQSGKTTLCECLVKEDSRLYLDQENVLNAINFDFKGYISLMDKPILIDEIQKADNLNNTLKFIVDRNKNKGQFLITGSSNPQYLPYAKETLAGRLGEIKLSTLTEAEIRGKENDFIDNLFNLNVPSTKINCSKDDIIELSLRGGYPDVLELTNENERYLFYKNYIDKTIRDDLSDIKGLYKIDSIMFLLNVIARYSSKYINKSKLSSVSGLDRETVDTYLAYLQALGLVYRLNPFSNSEYNRAIKNDKIFITDSGLFAALLNLNKASVLRDPDTCGKLIETFVFHELKAMIDLLPYYKLLQFRDTRNHEIDFIVENKSRSQIIGIEVKASNNISKQDFKNLIWFKENTIRKGTEFIGIVLYTGGLNSKLENHENMYALSIATLFS